MIAVDSLLNETELQVVVYSGQLDLIVDTLGQSPSCLLFLCCCVRKTNEFPDNILFVLLHI